MEGLRDSPLGWHPVMLFPTPLWSNQSLHPTEHLYYPQGEEPTAFFPTHLRLAQFHEVTVSWSPSWALCHLCLCLCLCGYVCIPGLGCWESPIMSLSSVSHATSQFCWGSNSKGVALWFFSPFASSSHDKLGPWCAQTCTWEDVLMWELCWPFSFLLIWD